MISCDVDDDDLERKVFFLHQPSPISYDGHVLSSLGVKDVLIDETTRRLKDN